MHLSEHIVADYAISECEWLDLEEESTIPKEKVTATKPKYVGWAVLGVNKAESVVYLMCCICHRQRVIKSNNHYDLLLKANCCLRVS